MVPGFTMVPGSTRILTTVASVSAGINSIESSRGVNVPVDPRTWRIMLPRFTVSGQTAEASTVGAAGFSRETANAAPARTTTATAIQTAIWRFFFRLISGRAISIRTKGCTWGAKNHRCLMH